MPERTETERRAGQQRRRPIWKIAEPTTTLTDLALAALTATFGGLLLRGGDARGEGAVVLWAAAFFSTSGSALLGALVHGLAPWMTAARKAALWRATMVLIGLTSFLLVAAVVVAETHGVARAALLVAAAGKLLAYLERLRRRDDFGAAALDSGLALLAVLALQLFAILSGSAPGPEWIVGGALLSLAGAAAQAGGVGFHRHFNHNDLFHVVQMVAACLFYRGALLL